MLNTDITPEVQPDKTYRFALNTLSGSLNGELNTLTNENSNSLCLEIPNIIGSLAIRDFHIIFALDGIYKADLTNCKSTKIQTNCDFNFNINYPIQATYKTLDYCNEIIIYWTDGLNPIRYLNITKPETQTNCNDYNLFKCSKEQKVLFNKVNDTGGFLKSGVYQFALACNDNVKTLTNPISIYDEYYYNNLYNNIDGCPANTTTNKSISLNIDTDCDLIFLYIIKTIGGVVEVEKLEVSNGIFTYTGQQGEATTLDEVLIPEAGYISAELITQMENRLILGRLKQYKNINYQQFANQINCRWITRKIPLTNGYKNPNTIYSHKSFMADEVYSFAVVVEFCDGTFSKAFHIPGPDYTGCFSGIKSIQYINNTEIEVEYTTVNEIVPKEDVNNYLGCDAPVWKVFNVGCISEEPHQELSYTYDECGNVVSTELGVWEKGALSYWEDCEIYSDDKDCNGDYLYGNLVGKHVRYHRMPARRIVPHYTSNNIGIVETRENNDLRPYAETYIYPIELEFTNIQPPIDSEIPVKAYHIVYAKRTDNNKSVLAKGVAHGTRVMSDPITGIEYSVALNAVNANPVNSTLQGPINIDRHYKFHSPNTSWNTNGHLKVTDLNVTHITQEFEYFGEGRVYGEVEDNQIVRRININLNGKIVNERQWNRNSIFSKHVEAHTITNGVNLPIWNIAGESGVYFAVKDFVPGLVDPIELFKLKYNCEVPFTLPSMMDFTDWSVKQYVSGGLNKIDCARAVYCALKNYKCSPYGLLKYQTYIEANNTIFNNTTVSGDSFINYWAYRRTESGMYTTEVQNPNYPNEDGEYLLMPQTTLIHSIVESDVNAELRHTGNVGLGETYYPHLQSWSLDPSIPLNANINSSYLSQFRYDNDEKIFINLGIDNYWSYNDDYSKINDIREYFAIGEAYKDCNCNTELTNTIAISDVDNYQGLIDNWQNFRFLNQIRIPRHYGRLTNLFTLSNDLFAHTEDNIWKIFKSNTELKTGEDNVVYLGNGSIFSQEPLYIYGLNEGIAGLQQTRGTTQNQNGYYFIDNKAGKLYKFSGEGLELLNNGINYWLLKYLPFKLSTQNNYTNDVGIGWHLTTDYRHNRLLITKKDYKPLQDGIYVEDFKYYDINNNEVFITDTTKFCNESFTLSYDLLQKGFISWHSYIPTNYINDRYNLLSSNTEGLWKHNEANNYQTFYNYYKPWVLELSSILQQTSTWNNIIYLQDCFLYNSQFNKEVLVDFTFNKVYVYNSYQNSGLLNMIKKSDDMLQAIDDNIIQVNRKERTYYFNEFTDNVIDYTKPHLVCNCIDNVEQLPNQNVLGYKPYYEIEDFRDNYIAYRLIQDDEEHYDKRFVYKIHSSNIQPSYR